MHLLGAHASFRQIPILRGPVGSETLHHTTRAVYPFDRSPTMVDRWNFIFVFDRLGHRNMEKLIGA
jgi:hypothetical protein